MEVIAKPDAAKFEELRSMLLESGLKPRGFQRVKRRARSTLSYLSNPGPLLTEPETLEDIRHLGYELIPGRDNKSVYDVAGVYTSLAKYGRQVEWSFCDEATLNEAKSLTLRAFGSQGHVLQALPLDAGLAQCIKMDKSAGLPEFGKKGDAFFSDLVRAMKIQEGRKTPDPCVAFHRVQHGPDGPKTRLVWGYPQAMTLIEARFAVPLIEHFLDVSTPMTLGLRKMQLGARMVRACNAGVQYGIDFSGFDSSVHRRLIKFAFDVLITFFDLNEEESQAWQRVYNYFTFTPIMMPDRSVWQKDHGVPSGSFFTQMVDSIVNYTAVMYGFIKTGGRAPADGEVLVLGDDALVGYHQDISLKTLRRNFSELGLTLNESKTKVTWFGREGPAFLGHSWVSGVATRPESELLQRMAFPEKPSRLKDAKARAAARVLSIGTSALSGHNLLRHLSPYKGNDIMASYIAIARRGGISSSVEGVTPDLMTGWRAHLEEIGVGESVGLASLGTKLPYTGILL